MSKNRSRMIFLIPERSIHFHTQFGETIGPGVQSPTQAGAGGGNKTQGSNTIVSTAFALKSCSYKIIAVDIVLTVTLTVS